MLSRTTSSPCALPGHEARVHGSEALKIYGLGKAQFCDGSFDVSQQMGSPTSRICPCPSGSVRLTGTAPAPEWNSNASPCLRNAPCAISNRSECKLKPGMLRGCQLVFRNERAGGGTGLARRKFVYDPPPSAQSAAVAVLRLASQARCGGRANLADCFRVITTVA